LDAARTDPEHYKPSPNINLRYQYPVPLEGASANAHPVFLEFDGSPMDFPVADEKVEAPSALLKFFRSANLANRNGRNEDFAASFTAKSGGKVKQWQAATEKRRESEQKNSAGKSPVSTTAATTPPTTPPESAKPPVPGPSSAVGPPKGANVKFVLNADPVFLVFQAPGLGNDWLPASLAYTYVISEGGAFKIANFGFGNTLDEVLQDPALFDKRILKPAPAKSGAQKAKVPPSSAKPAGARP
jgi:hypothetical protein